MATFAAGWNFAVDPTLTAANLNAWATATVTSIARSEQAAAFRLVRADNVAPGDTGEIAYSSVVDALFLKTQVASAGTLDDGSSTAPTAMRTRDWHGTTNYTGEIPGKIIDYDATNLVPYMGTPDPATVEPIVIRKSTTVFHIAGCVTIDRAQFDADVTKGEYVHGSTGSSGKLGSSASPVYPPATIGVALKDIGTGASGGCWLWPGGM